MTTQAPPYNDTVRALSAALTAVQEITGCGDFYAGKYEAEHAVELLISAEEAFGEPDPVELLPPGPWTPGGSRIGFALGWDTPPTKDTR